MTNPIDRIGKFEIIERLGEGSTGEVFLARDTIIGREVALKIIRKASLAGPDPEARFLREALAASRLSHPNLVTIHEFGDKAGVLFLVMDHVAGEDLGTQFKAGAFTPKEALEVLAQVCDGLAYAHQHGILHRNLKPSNVRMGRVAGRPAPKVLDVGMSRTGGNDPAHLATLAYAAPEAIQPARAEARSDLYSVGAMLYETLAGSRPFEGDSPAALAQQVREEQPAPLDLQLFPELSPSIQDILSRALAKDPAGRFPSAEAMAATLRAARNPGWTLQMNPVETVETARLVPIPARTKAKAPSGSHRVLAWTSALAVVLVLAGAGGFWLRSRGQARAAAARARAAAQAAAQAAVQAAAPAPPPAAVPEPPARAQPVLEAPAPQVASTAKPPYTTLDAAADALGKDPEGALAFLDQTVAAEPGNERACALRIVALYNLARYGASGKAIREAREAGHPLWPMALRNPPLREMLERDVKGQHLPKRKAAPAPAPAPETAPEEPAA